MEPDTAGSCALIEIRCYRLGDLVLQVAQVLPLRSNAAGAIRCIPRGHQPARFLVVLDLERDFVHHSNPSLPTDLGQVAPTCRTSHQRSTPSLTCNPINISALD